MNATETTTQFSTWFVEALGQFVKLANEEAEKQGLTDEERKYIMRTTFGLLSGKK